MEKFVILKIFFLSTLSFIFAIAWTPILTHFLYKYRLGKNIRSSKLTPIFSALHSKKAGTPTMGGVLIWLSVAVIIFLLYYLGKFFGGFWHNLNFLSRSETLLPLGALIASAVIGLIDDLIDIWKKKGMGGGLKMRHRIFIYAAIAAIGALWFYFKLDWTTIRVPFVGSFDIGLWYIPIFIFIIIATAFSVNEIDGLDGLAGGVLLTSFGSFGVIAFMQGKYDLAVFCGVIIGALLAFLWFNIHPARFFMGDTGAMSLGVTLGIIAMLTNSALLLPIIGMMLVVESLSVIIQLASKRFRGKKVFRSAPFHHHLEAIGWQETKIVMRFWVISGIFSVIGLMLFMIDHLQKGS